MFIIDWMAHGPWVRVTDSWEVILRDVTLEFFGEIKIRNGINMHVRCTGMYSYATICTTAHSIDNLICVCMIEEERKLNHFDASVACANGQFHCCKYSVIWCCQSWIAHYTVVSWSRIIIILNHVANIHDDMNGQRKWSALKLQCV